MGMRAPLDPAESALAVAFERAGLGMALVDAGTARVVRVNPALCAFLGCTPGELVGRGWESTVHPLDARLEEKMRSAALAGESPAPVDMRFRHRDGRTVWGQLMRSVVRGADGRPAWFIDQVLDLTERMRAEKEIVLLNNLLEQRIQKRTAALEESNDDLRDFAYSLAHDLRGPLASIDGFSAQLQARAAELLDARSSHYLQRVRAGVRTMSDLTDGLLALADLSRSDLEMGAVDLSALAEAILERRQELQPERHVQWQVNDTPAARGDRRLLADVMENLLGNAWKFTSGKEAARIVFDASTDASGTIYRVQDNGAGFDPAYIDKLFAPFQRLHTATEFEGTGIGLAMVRKIIVRHGGRIWADAAPGQGATFWFTIGEREAWTPSQPAAL